MGVDLERLPVRAPTRRDSGGGGAGALRRPPGPPQGPCDAAAGAGRSCATRACRCSTTLVGDGPERERAGGAPRASSASTGQVELTGAVGQDELPGLYRDADVFCLPTLAEAVGVVNMEAMATGLRGRHLAI